MRGADCQPAFETGPACAYMPAMPAWLCPILFLLTVAAMEGVAYAAHRWVMHGPGWVLHRSHHRPRAGRLGAERPLRRDLRLSLDTADPRRRPARLGRVGDVVGAGIAAYGAIYFGFHDVIVHKRVPTDTCRAPDILSVYRPGPPAAPRGGDQGRHCQFRLPDRAAPGGTESRTRPPQPRRRACAARRGLTGPAQAPAHPECRVHAARHRLAADHRPECCALFELRRRGRLGSGAVAFGQLPVLLSRDPEQPRVTRFESIADLSFLEGWWPCWLRCCSSRFG